MKMLLIFLALTSNAFATESVLKLSYKVNNLNPGLVILEDILLLQDGKTTGVSGLMSVNDEEDPCTSMLGGEFSGADFIEYRRGDAIETKNPQHVYLNSDGSVSHLKSDYHVPVYAVVCKKKNESFKGYRSRTNVANGVRFDGLHLNYRGKTIPLNVYMPRDAEFFCKEFMGSASTLVDASFSKKRDATLSEKGDAIMGRSGKFFMSTQLDSIDNMVLTSIVCK
ncbi:MAG: hypothetical protein ACOYL6_15255 [Bacteriovoracaceae bacterium]